jgi:hypothetical protein
MQGDRRLNQFYIRDSATTVEELYKCYSGGVYFGRLDHEVTRVERLHQCEAVNVCCVMGDLLQQQAFEYVPHLC